MCMLVDKGFVYHKGIACGSSGGLALPNSLRGIFSSLLCGAFSLSFLFTYWINICYYIVYKTWTALCTFWDLSAFGYLKQVFPLLLCAISHLALEDCSAFWRAYRHINIWQMWLLWWILGVMKGLFVVERFNFLVISTLLIYFLYGLFFFPSTHFKYDPLMSFIF